jgi:hypothetical protein
VLDTGVADHRWFDADAADPICIRASTPDADGRDAASNSHQHGTFVAGVIRQAAPDARILSVELRQDKHGKPLAGEICAGLQWLLDRPPTPEVPFVDVVCLAVGYRHAPDANEHHADRIKAILCKFEERGVLLVCAAGNRPEADRTDHDVEVYPAALADTQTEFPIVAVRATTLDGRPADFNVEGGWATREWVGDAVVSAFPKVTADRVWIFAGPGEVSDVDEVARLPEGDRAAMTFASGYAVGRGSSFAAAGFAGRVAQAMLDEAGPGGLADLDPAAAKKRVIKAMATAGGKVSATPRSDQPSGTEPQ